MMESKGMGKQKRFFKYFIGEDMEKELSLPHIPLEEKKYPLNKSKALFFLHDLIENYVKIFTGMTNLYGYYRYLK